MAKRAATRTVAANRPARSAPERAPGTSTAPVKSPKPAAVRIALASVMVVAIAVLATVSMQEPIAASGAVAASADHVAINRISREPTQRIEVDQVKPATLDELIALPPGEREAVDLGRANLLVAKHAIEELELADSFDIDAHLATLDRWAERVASETDRNFHLFDANPAEYNHSEADYRILTLVTVLQQDLGVSYNMERLFNPDFTKPEDQFIHGMLPGQPHAATGGTCVSMPVLCAAIARRLGYPVHLVTTQAHVFCRWDGEFRGKAERFNIEASGERLSNFEDEHYLNWPHRVTPDQIARHGFLASMDTNESIALFVSASAHAMHDTERFDRAIATYMRAARLDPSRELYRMFAASAARAKSSQLADARRRSVNEPIPRANPNGRFNPAASVPRPATTSPWVHPQYPR